MKINIEVDFQDFYNDFESFDEYVKDIFKKDVLKAVKQSSEYKMAVLKHSRAVAAGYLAEYGDKVLENEEKGAHK